MVTQPPNPQLRWLVVASGLTMFACFFFPVARTGATDAIAFPWHAPIVAPPYLVGLRGAIIAWRAPKRSALLLVVLKVVAWASIAVLVVVPFVGIATTDQKSRDLDALAKRQRAMGRARQHDRDAGLGEPLCDGIGECQRQVLFAHHGARGAEVRAAVARV